MTILSALTVTMLAVVAVWFFWPMVADPIARVRNERTKDDADRKAEDLFELWSKYGRGTPLLMRADRN